MKLAVLLWLLRPSCIRDGVDSSRSQVKGYIHPLDPWMALITVRGLWQIRKHGPCESHLRNTKAIRMSKVD
jgi:hypothetical protein